MFSASSHISTPAGAAQTGLLSASEGGGLALRTPPLLIKPQSFLSRFTFLVFIGGGGGGGSDGGLFAYLLDFLFVCFVFLLWAFMGNTRVPQVAKKASNHGAASDSRAR